MLDPYEFSNNIKLSYFKDYNDLFQDTSTFLFGQGVGAVHYFSSLGKSLKITELTLLEIIRQLGAICGIIFILWVLFPLLYLGVRSSKPLNWLGFGYSAYLLVCLSNYFLLSSTGIFLVALCYSVAFGVDFRDNGWVELTENAATKVLLTEYKPFSSSEMS